jgi:hypothetical protein
MKGIVSCARARSAKELFYVSERKALEGFRRPGLKERVRES